jgi:hypothetical protein
VLLGPVMINQPISFDMCAVKGQPRILTLGLITNGEFYPSVRCIRKKEKYVANH